jgi:hypothetical protein
LIRSADAEGGHAKTLAWRVREHFPAITPVERGSLNVAPYLGWTADIFEGPNGGAYINNNPGASLTGAIPLILLRPFLVRVGTWNRSLPRPNPRSSEGELFERTLDQGRAFYFLLVAFLTVALVMAPATAGTAAYLCSRLAAGGLPAASAACVALLYGLLGTPVLFRTRGSAANAPEWSEAVGTGSETPRTGVA